MLLFLGFGYGPRGVRENESVVDVQVKATSISRKKTNKVQIFIKEEKIGVEGLEMASVQPEFATIVGDVAIMNFDLNQS